MKTFLSKFCALLFVATSFSGCARDLSSETYTSSSTLNIVLSGQLVSSRIVKVKESDKVEAGSGTAVGGLGGAAAGYAASNRAEGLIGGAVAGAVLGTFMESALSRSTGVEYIVKVDTSKVNPEYYEGSSSMRNSLAAVKTSGIITVIQAKPGKNEPNLNVGQKVLVIISENRTRVIPDASN